MLCQNPHRSSSTHRLLTCQTDINISTSITHPPTHHCQEVTGTLMMDLSFHLMMLLFTFICYSHVDSWFGVILTAPVMTVDSVCGAFYFILAAWLSSPSLVWPLLTASTLEAKVGSSLLYILIWHARLILATVVCKVRSKCSHTHAGRVARHNCTQHTHAVTPSDSHY